MVKASQLLFCEEGAMSHHLLFNLHSRLWKEGAADTLGAEVTRQLKDNIILLIKATGQCPPVLASSTSLLELLNKFAASTDKPRMSPGEPKMRDLGLLREKVKYTSPALQAERLIPKLEPGSSDSGSDGGDFNEDVQDPEMGDDPSDVEAMGADATPEQGMSSFDDFGIRNIPLGTATQKNWSRDKLAMSGVSLCLGHDKLETLMKSLLPSKHVERMNARNVPIGMQLVQERVEDAGEQDIDYNVHHQQVAQEAEKMDSLLLTRCRDRGWKAKHITDGATKKDERSVESRGTKKRTLATDESESSAESSGRKKQARVNDKADYYYANIVPARVGSRCRSFQGHALDQR
jgi:hypothetical protein